MSHSLYRSSLQQLQVPNQCIARKNEGFDDRHTNVIDPQTYKLETRFRPKEQRRTLKSPIEIETVMEELSSDKNPIQENRIDDPTKITKLMPSMKHTA